MGVGFQKENEQNEALNDAQAFNCLLLGRTLMGAIFGKTTNQPTNAIFVNE